MLLQQRGHSVEVVTNRWPKHLAGSEVIDGITVRRYKFLVPMGVRGGAQFVLFSLIEFCKLLVSSKRFAPDVIHIICCSTNVPYAVLLSRILRVPLVISTHGEIGMDSGRLYQSRNVISNNLSSFSKHAVVVTACSRSTADEFSSFCPGIKCEVLRNGVDLTEFSNKPLTDIRDTCCEYVFAYGRLVPQKGFGNLLRAWKLVDVQGTKLMIAGDGPDLQVLMDLADELQIQNTVEFLGRLNRKDVANRLRYASAFVLPSIHEPFGLVILEAMAARVPVIATKVGGVPEFVVDGRTGTLVEHGDIEGLAVAIRRHLEQTISQYQLSSAYETACKYEWNSVINDYLLLYRSAMAVN
jgi:glycogen(starch) synthase